MANPTPPSAAQDPRRPGADTGSGDGDVRSGVLPVSADVAPAGAGTPAPAEPVPGAPVEPRQRVSLGDHLPGPATVRTPAPTPPDTRDDGDEVTTPDEPAEEGKRKGSFWKELPILLFTALLLTFLIQTFVARVYVIPSASMERTLHGCNGCVNDRVLVDKVTYLFTDPGPGDVVVFRGPGGWAPEFQGARSGNLVVRWVEDFGSALGIGTPNERDFVKRVIAVGGQTVECCDDQGRVKVDGRSLEEPYVHFAPGTGDRMRPFDKVVVPEGHLWMMGDNRNNSADSREAGHGAVPVAEVIGKARAIVLPLNRLGGIDDHNPQNVALGVADQPVSVPGTVGLAAAFPVLALGRRTRTRLRSRSVGRIGRDQRG